ncbi:MAG: lysophospholipase, partial [Bacilli bacterium]|nr:lysophospholipase [Bacilli bacterium]
KYFHQEDFPNLKADPYSFYSAVNKLNGYFYYYDGYQEDVLVIFCHGIGGGHSSYLQEINNLAKHGYKVLAYDNTGCCNSEGKNIHTLGQSLVDLSYALASVRKNFNSKKIYVVGHSWGGYAVSNINNFMPVDKVVAISPFISIKREYKDIFPFPLKLIVKKIVKLEYIRNGDYAHSCAIKALNKKNVSALVIASKDDSVIKFKHHTGKLMKKVKNSKVQFVIYDNKNHQPHYEKESVDYYNEKFGEFNQLVKDKKITTLEEKKAFFEKVDFLFMTKQDDNVWQEIYNFLDK